MLYFLQMSVADVNAVLDVAAHEETESASQEQDDEEETEDSADN